MTDTFKWTAPEGDTIELPSLRRLKAGTIRKYRKLGGDDYMFTLLEELLDEKTLARIDDLDASDFNEMCEKWSAELGES